MPDEITFMDVASLLKITPNTPLEKLGSTLNASIFDASNVAGTLKQKGLIEFTANYPGPNSITITETGNNLIKEADAKATMPMDSLDESILAQLSGGKRLPVELQNTLNIRPRDLAMRLYKLDKQGLMIYELKNGGVELLLTEQGFLMAKGGQIQRPATPQPTQQAMPQAKPAAPQPMAQPQSGTMPNPYGQAAAQPMPSQSTTAGTASPAPTAMPPKPRRKMGPMLPIIVLIVVVALVVVLYHLNIITI